MEPEALGAGLAATAGTLLLLRRAGARGALARFGATGRSVMALVREADPEDETQDALMLAAAGRLFAQSAALLGLLLLGIGAFGAIYLGIAAAALGGLDAALAPLAEPVFQVALLFAAIVLVALGRHVRL